MKMTSLLPSRRLLKGTLILLAAASLTSLSAVSAVITEKFDTAGPTPEGWTVARYNQNTVPNIDVRDSGLGYTALWMNRPRITDVNTYNYLSALYYTGDSEDGTIIDGQVANFTASVIISSPRISPAPGAFNGMVIRATSNSYKDNGGYFIAFNASDEGNSGLGIWATGTAHQAKEAQALLFNDFQTLPDGFFDDFNGGASLLLSITAIGSTIEASLWTLDDNGDADLQIGSLLYKNATVTGAGTIGLKSAFDNTNTTGYFRDFQLQSIPEPGTVAMLMGAGAMVVLLRLRRRV